MSLCVLCVDRKREGESKAASRTPRPGAVGRTADFGVGQTGSLSKAVMRPVSDGDCLHGPDPKHLPPPRGKGQIMNSHWSDHCGGERLSGRQGLDHLASESSSRETSASHGGQAVSKCPRPGNSAHRRVTWGEGVLCGNSPPRCALKCGFCEFGKYHILYSPPEDS